MEEEGKIRPFINGDDVLKLILKAWSNILANKDVVDTKELYFLFQMR